MSRIDAVDNPKGLIFDIKKFSTNDGPGIRTTVFFKGCPLKCSWCHNPESIAAHPQVVFYENRCLADKHACRVSCPKNGLSRNHAFSADPAICDGCGECADNCPSDAVRVIGRPVTVSDLLSEIKKDAVFFDHSHGGVTFSGGEPLLQLDFLREILARCREERIHTALDTSGFAPYERIASLLHLVDLFLYDLKFIDNDRHRHYTGVDNDVVLANLKKIVAAGKPLVVRIPLIPGITDALENLSRIVAFLETLPQPLPVSLLNFHRGGEQKYRRLGMPYALGDLQPLPDEKVASIRDLFAAKKIAVTIGE